MFTQLDRIAVGLLRPINPYAQFITGSFTLLWGFWLLLPQFDVFGTAPLFSKMAEFAPEWAWGAWATAAGILIILGVINGLYSVLARTLAFAAWHWTTVSIMMWWGDWHNTGGITYGFIALLFVYCYLNIKFNYVDTGHDQKYFASK